MLIAVPDSVFLPPNMRRFRSVCLAVLALSFVVALVSSLPWPLVGETSVGCVSVLYDLRLRQSTGFLYDCYLFADPSEERDTYRAAFWASFEVTEPRVVVQTDQFCFSKEKGFDRVNRWPMLEAELARNYEVRYVWKPSTQQHWWNRREEPTAFRIYVRKS